METQIYAEPEEEDPLILPWDAVGKVTAGDYLRKSRYFLEFSGLVDPAKMYHETGPQMSREFVEEEKREIRRGMMELIRKSKADPKYAKRLVLRFIEADKQRIQAGEIGPYQLKGSLKPIKLALELNEVPMAWKKIQRLVPKVSRRSQDREYTLEEIRRALSAVSLHLQVAILFMASSGMRVGAFEYLNVWDVRPVYRLDGEIVLAEKDRRRFSEPLPKGAELLCGVVTVYAGEGDDEYETLVSKEAYLAFQDYIATRRAGGEKIMAESSAIVTRNGARRVEATALRSSLGKLFRRAGLWTERKKRHEVQMNHGFRKFFDNVAKDHIDEAYVEKLIGHNTGTKEHYDRHLPKPLIEEYLVAMPYLSIDEAYRAEAKLSKELEESKKVHSEDFNEVRLQLLETRAQLDEERRKREESEKRTVELVEEGRKLLEEMRAEKGRKGPR